MFLPVVLNDMHLADGRVLTLTFGPAGSYALQANLTIAAQPGTTEYVRLSELHEGAQFDLELKEPEGAGN